jgi:putative transposase
MARLKLIRSPHLPYHIVTRCNNKEWFDLPLHKVWQIALESLEYAYEKEKVDLISFVLMNNHYHMMLKTPEQNLDRFMYFFNKQLSLELRMATKRINKIFGGRYKWCLIRNLSYFSNCYRYVYQNPLRAKMVKSCESYPYSTLHYITNKKEFPIPIHDQFWFKDRLGLSWLNKEVKKSELEAIRRGLYNRELTKLKDEKSRRLLTPALHNT